MNDDHKAFDWYGRNGRVTDPRLRQALDQSVPNPHSARPHVPVGIQRSLLLRYHVDPLGQSIYDILAVTGWLATTLLATAGLFVVLFVAAGNGTFDGFFEQIALLATHYGQVNAVALAPFNRELTIAANVVFVITGFFRRASLLSLFKAGGVDGLR